MAPYHKDILVYFQHNANSNAPQQTLQGQYLNFAYCIDAMANCPEKSVAIRKLLESFDAGMRALS